MPSLLSEPRDPGLGRSFPDDRDCRKNFNLSVHCIICRCVHGQSPRLAATVVSVIATDKDGKQQVSTQPVEVGLRAGDQVEIRGGLSEGQQVLVK